MPDFVGTDGPDVLTGTTGNDRIFGRNGDDILIGLAGADYLDGGHGADVMQGGTEDDVYVVDNNGDTAVEVAGEGFDTIYTYVDYELAAGTSIERLSAVDWRFSTPLVLIGNEIANLIEGNAGNNFLDGRAGADTMYGFGGDDTYVVDNAGDVVIESDVFLSPSGSDTIYTSVDYQLTPGNSIEVLRTSDPDGLTPLTLRGNELSNTIVGNAGNNLLVGGGGPDDALYGLGGDDIYIVLTNTTVREEENGGQDTVYVLADYTLTSGSYVERLSAIDWTFTTPLSITGNEFANIIEGNAGNNVLSGGSTGLADTMYGFGGNDTYHMYRAGDIVVERASEGTDTVIAHAQLGELPDNVENLTAGVAGLQLIGNAGANVITGTNSADLLDGRGGADTLIGNGGNDTYVVDRPDDVIVSVSTNDVVYTSSDYTLTGALRTLSSIDWSMVLNLHLTGNSGANVIHGDAGDNVIDGKGGSDFLLGHGGADTFLFTTGGQGNVDQLPDFVPGTDVIALDHNVFTTLGLGALPPEAFALGSGGPANSTQKIIYNPNTGTLSFDPDGPGFTSTVTFATLPAHTDLYSTDFIVI